MAKRRQINDTAEVPVAIRSPAPKPARVVVGAATIGGRPRSKPSLLSLGAIGIIVYGG